ncbi:MAG TPA: sigma-70 family RNA polymerase sigma factor [Dehalococcoidia bacterium]
MDTDTPDLDLIARARQDDLSAFNLLVERYQTGVYSLCLRMLGAPAPAEDAAQEAFISAYRSLDRFRGGSFRAWLFRIAANACYDELRRRKARPATSLDRTGDEDERPIEPPDTAPSMEDRAANAELHRDLELALAQLPDEQRLAIVLCDVQGFDYAEIAEAMRVSLGTVKSRISRARSRLRTILLARREPLPGRVRQSGEEL